MQILQINALCRFCRKVTNKMPYKVYISEINVLAYLQRVAILKFLITTMLEVIMLPKVPTKIESRL